MSELTHSFYIDGIDVEDLGLHYAPEVKGNDTYVWNPAAAKVAEQIFESHDGGYYYGKSLQPKEFILRCYYEQTPQEEGLLNEVLQFFYVGRLCTLSFERRPWLYYNVRITNVDINTMYNFQNGLVIIRAKAYTPYSYSSKEYNDYDTSTWDYNILYNNSNIWNSGSILYPTKSLISSSTSISTVGNNYYLYNPGDEPVNAKITVCANATAGLSIKSLTNNSQCLVQPITTDKTIIIDGESAKTYDSSGNMCFQYHKAGYLTLNPDKYLKNATFSINGTTITVSRQLTAAEIVWIKARGFAYNGSTAVRISNASGSTITLSDSISGTINICTLNKINISAATTATVNTLIVDYNYKFE